MNHLAFGWAYVFISFGLSILSLQIPSHHRIQIQTHDLPKVPPNDVEETLVEHVALHLNEKQFTEGMSLHCLQLSASDVEFDHSCTLETHRKSHALAILAALQKPLPAPQRPSPEPAHNAQAIEKLQAQLAVIDKALKNGHDLEGALTFKRSTLEEKLKRLSTPQDRTPTPTITAGQAKPIFPRWPGLWAPILGLLLMGWVQSFVAWMTQGSANHSSSSPGSSVGHL